MSKYSNDNPLVYTIKNLCRVCYTCVRECPVKAIKIINGQAEVITERCIACGNCVVVCSQHAKTYQSSVENVSALLSSNHKTIACVAPSFPAEFTEISDYRQFVGMLRELGFSMVTEVSFGADLVAKAYDEIFNDDKARSIITSDCPAIVYYIKHYHPELVELLAPVVSPAMAMADVVKQKYGTDSKVVFIGPCMAKKAESDSFDEVLTFVELRKLFAEKNIRPNPGNVSDFDPPHAGSGAFFPVNHGLLKSIGRAEGLGRGEVITAEGKARFKEAIDELEKGVLKNQHLELLCCDGCILGPGMSKRGDKLVKRMKISEYVHDKMQRLDIEEWNQTCDEFASVGLFREFASEDRRMSRPKLEEIEAVYKAMGKVNATDFLNCGACGYPSCEEHAIAVTQGLAEVEMCLPNTIDKLHVLVNELHVSHKKLSRTREALKHSEKMASMGQVSAGIAHELNNPLGIITLYSSILKDEIPEGNPYYEDIKMIDEQAERCKTIVGGLLNFARKNQVVLKEIDFVQFMKTGLKSVVVPENVQTEIQNSMKNPMVHIDYEQMMQVVTNIEKNAIEAMPDGGTLKIELSDEPDLVMLNISDTGTGIAKENIEKIFTPFFTTKGVGKGTGLGLPLVYGIIKMHKGKINVRSNNDPEIEQTGTTFCISFPR